MKLLLVCCFLLFLTVPALADDDEVIDKGSGTLEELKDSKEQPKTPSIKTPKNKPPHLGWYLLNNNNKCTASEGPASLIKTIQQLKKLGTINSKVTDLKVENGKPVIVKISADDGVMSIGGVFYRSKELCKSAAKEIDKKNAAEIDRYR